MRNTQVHYTQQQIAELHSELLAAKERTQSLVNQIKKMAKDYYDVPVKGWFLNRTRRERKIGEWDDEVRAFLDKLGLEFEEEWNQLMESNFVVLRRYVTKPEPTGISFDYCGHMELVNLSMTADYWTDHQVIFAEIILDKFDVLTGEYRTNTENE